MRIEWRRHLREIEVGGVPVNYVELGSGPGIDLVFVHGLSGSWQNWLENLPHFAAGHRVVALDLPGFGRTPLPRWTPTIPSYARFLLDFCEAVGIGECAVVGNSMGGFIAAESAITQPGRFEKLVLVSAAGISAARMRREPAELAGRLAIASSPLVLKLQERGLRRPGLRYWAFRMVFHDPMQVRPELLWEYFTNGAGRAGFLPALVNLTGYDFLDRLEVVEVPTLIVWGREDRIVPSADAVEYGHRLANSQTVIFGDTGHVPMAERPVRFNRLLEAFLAR